MNFNTVNTIEDTISEHRIELLRIGTAFLFITGNLLFMYVTVNFLHHAGLLLLCVMTGVTWR